MASHITSGVEGIKIAILREGRARLVFIRQHAVNVDDLPETAKTINSDGIKLKGKIIPN
jgi:hypothetical protein